MQSGPQDLAHLRKGVRPHHSRWAPPDGAGANELLDAPYVHIGSLLGGLGVLCTDRIEERLTVGDLELLQPPGLHVLRGLLAAEELAQDQVGEVAPVDGVVARHCFACRCASAHVTRAIAPPVNEAGCRVHLRALRRCEQDQTALLRGALLGVGP